MAAQTTVAKKTAAKKVVTVPKKKSASPPQNVNLHAYIPSITVKERYVNRKVWGVWDSQIATTALANAQNILLKGDTGAGKTMFGEAYAAAYGLLYYSLACDVSIDPTSLFGRMQPTSRQGVFKWQDGPITQIWREGGVLNVSEVNFMPPKIAASLYPAMDGRRYIPLLAHEGEIVRAHIGTHTKEQTPCWCGSMTGTKRQKDDCNRRRVLVIADMNPQYRGTMDLNAAFKNRFDFKIPWGYDSAVEEKLVKFPTLLEIAQQLRNAPNTDITTPVSTNMLMEFEGMALDPVLGLEFAKNNFLAAFESDEIEPISKAFDLHQKKLEKDVAHFAAKSASGDDDDDLEEVEWDMEKEQS